MRGLDVVYPVKIGDEGVEKFPKLCLQRKFGSGGPVPNSFDAGEKSFFRNPESTITLSVTCG